MLVGSTKEFDNVLSYGINWETHKSTKFIMLMAQAYVLLKITNSHFNVADIYLSLSTNSDS